MRNRNWILATVGTLVIGLSGPGFAFGRGGPGLGGPERGGPGPRGLLEQLISPCRAACSDTARTCSESADSAALTCISGACSAEVTAAQSACAADRRAQPCRDAVRALRDCGDSCINTRATALGTCHEALSDCLDACDSAQE